jgi:hypothetical protein
LGLSSLLPAIKEKLITSDIKDTSQIPSEILPLTGLRHFLVKNSLKPIYSNGFTSI